MRRHFNKSKFVRNVIAPFQFTIGLLMLILASGAEGIWVLVFAAAGLVLMILTMLYERRGK